MSLLLAIQHSIIKAVTLRCTGPPSAGEGGWGEGWRDGGGGGRGGGEEGGGWREEGRGWREELIYMQAKQHIHLAKIDSERSLTYMS